MLKVVGASWWQTRVSSYILGATGVFAVFVLVLGELGSRVENDGIYSATVYWPRNYRVEFWGQSNVLEEVPQGVARAYFNPDKSENGWSVLEIETHGHYADWKQAYAAGLLEGSLSWHMIYQHWQNTVENVCQDKQDVCEKIREYLLSNTEWVRNAAAERSDKDAFWHQVNLFYYQMDGLEQGFNSAVKRSRRDIEIPSVDFLWMNFDQDLVELMQKFGGLDILEKPSIESSLVKLIWKDAGDPKVVLGHNTEGLYGKMLRMLKRYKFNYHHTADVSKTVPGKEIVFSGYPGCLSSQDDLYSVASNDKHKHSLLISGTRLRNYNKNALDKLNFEEQVLIAPRVMAANRLATDGRWWYRYLYRANSGTGNKQWQVVNLSKLRSIKTFGRQTTGILWVIEQMPGIVHGTDQTHHLFNHTFWPSFGLPHYKETAEPSNVPEMKQKHGSAFSRKHSKLAEVFNSCRTNCSTFEEVKEFMTITLPFSGSGNASRGDLLPEPVPSGFIDSKIVLGTQDGVDSFQAYSGPLHTEIPSFLESYLNILEGPESGNETVPAEPFIWSSSVFSNNVSHFGQPDLWSFDFFQPDWVWI